MRIGAVIILALTTVFCWTGSGRAGEMEAEWGLSLAGAAVVVSNPFEQTDRFLSRARFQLKLYLGSSAFLEGHYQATLVLGRDAGLRGGGKGVRLRLLDPEPEIASGDDYLLLQNLDRLWLNLDLGPIGVGLGRQVIGHGPGRIFNPSDIFGPLPLFTTYTEYKSGVDALRLTRDLESGGEVELIGVAHRDGLEKGIGVIRLAREFKGWGFSAYGGYSLGRPTLGLALSGNLGPAGWYAEGLGRFEEDTVLRASAGLDYRFPFGLEVLGEVYHNGSGSGDRSGYGSVRQGKSWENGEIFLVGRWYAALYLGYEITPLIRGDLTWIQNLNDGSAMIMGGLSWDLTDRVLLRAGALVGLGQETALGEEGDVFGSEFGDYGISMYLELRITY